MGPSFQSDPRALCAVQLSCCKITHSNFLLFIFLPTCQLFRSKIWIGSEGWILCYQPGVHTVMKAQLKALWGTVTMVILDNGIWNRKSASRWGSRLATVAAKLLLWFLLVNGELASCYRLVTLSLETSEINQRVKLGRCTWCLLSTSQISLRLVSGGGWKQEKTE